MKPANIIYVVSRLWMIIAVFFIVPLAFSLFYDDGMYLHFIITSLGIITLSSIIWPFGTKTIELTIREGFILVNLCWISLALFGGVPFLTSGHVSNMTDAFFETMSGFSTTGATILRDIEVLPKSLLLWRNMTQWLGGMGVIALAVAIFPFTGMGGAHLFKAEVPGPTKDKISSRISDTAKLLWGVYLIFTVIQTGMLMMVNLSLFDALCITFGTLATGGFAPLNASIAHFPSPWVHYIIILFMILAGINFNLHYWALRGHPVHYFRNPELRFFLFVIAGSTILIVAIRIFTGIKLTEEAIRDALFHTVSLVTTTGFVTKDYELWPAATQIILFILMFIGGCASSTGGAIKNVRILVLLKYIGVEVKKLFYPHGVFPVKMQGKPVADNLVSNIVAFIALYILFFVFGTLAMACVGLDIISAAGSVAATLGNVGPGLGSVGPMRNFADVHPLGKWILSFMMLAGRLEIYTVFVLLTRRFWK
jgi:trk system potassium uptake protein TrkH